VAAVGRIRVASVVDQVYAVLRARILTGELAPGERLRQENLARELGISRTPLREALRLLATERLVTLETNRGARVTPIDPGEEQAAWFARLVLEPAAARAGATIREPEAIDAMREAIRAQGSVASDAATFEANRGFHLALVATAGNRHLSRFAELVWVPRIGMTIFQRQATTPGRLEAWAKEHAAIADAVAAGDAEAAERLTRAHIERYPPGPTD
jgi:DNA-binding GntR family transcriptional regulator